MRLLYNFGIYLFYFLVKIASLFSKQIGKALKTCKAQVQSLALTKKKSSSWVWFHVSSLGEYEQAKPVIELTRKSFPKLAILMTFFSPSGFEVRKHATLADHIMYLPLDTPQNAALFVRSFDLVLACFTKSEYWLNYLITLKKAQIPIINFAASFKTNQLFFRPWGQFYRSFLFYFDHILVQNDSSEKLLHKIGYHKTLVTGDTRFDRVTAIASGEKPIHHVKLFQQKCTTIVFGSIWEHDFDLLRPIISRLQSLKIKLIIAPHKVDPQHIEPLKKACPNYLLFSQLLKNSKQPVSQKTILIVDTIGHLASVYQHADVTYVGGAFRGAVHNILEPVAYRLPVIIGKDKRNKKFQEVADLINLGVVSEVSTPEQLLTSIKVMLTRDYKESKRKLIADYMDSHQGASIKTVSVIRSVLNESN